jgi:protein-L-isoaspartate O-methyltransferase
MTLSHRHKIKAGTNPILPMEIEIAISGPVHVVSALRERLAHLSPAFEETAEEAGTLRVRETEKGLDDRLLAISRIVTLLEKDYSLREGLALRVRNLAYSEPETGEASEEPFRPICSLRVQPWHSSLSTAPDPRTIVIDEKHAFGTGRHPSTVLCLKAVEEIALNQGGITGKNVLDFGCGTGLLAISAVKMGAEEAVGIEIDRDSAATAAKNVILNQVSGKVTVRQGSWDVVQQEMFDLILANLVPSALFRTGHEILNHLKKGGRVVISGFSEKQAEEMKAYLCSVGLLVIKRSCLDGWAAFVATFPS